MCVSVSKHPFSQSSLFIFPYLAVTSSLSFKAKAEVLHAAVVKIPGLGHSLCRFGWAWQKKIIKNKKEFEDAPLEVHILLECMPCLPSASICAWSLPQITSFFNLGGKNWPWESGRVIDIRFTEINEAVSKRESSLSAHNKILRVKLIGGFLFLLCLTK